MRTAIKKQVKEFLKLKPTFKLLNIDYSILEGVHKIRNHSKGVELKCLQCGNIEFRTLAWLASKYGCMCTRAEKIGQTQSLGEQAFIDRAKLVKRKLRLISPYRRLNGRITLECLRCNHVWSPSANNTLKGAGCPVCAPELMKKRCRKEHGVDYTFQRESVKAKRKQTMLEKYGVEHALQNRELFDKSRARMEILKDYRLGRRVVQVQGYEPQALDWLLTNKNIRPSQIQCGVGSKVPVISYRYKGKQHSYHPDIYIPHLNLVLEVKSKYTYQYGLARNTEKRKACKKAGYNFKYLVMTKSGERLRDY